MNLNAQFTLTEGKGFAYGYRNDLRYSKEGKDENNCDWYFDDEIVHIEEELTTKITALDRKSFSESKKNSWLKYNIKMRKVSGLGLKFKKFILIHIELER